MSAYSGVVLICWEHHHIPALASSLPAVAGTSIPQTWPDDRFDVIWAFTLVSAAPAPAVQYAFAQIPQQLLSGDADTIISVLPQHLAQAHLRVMGDAQQRAQACLVRKVLFAVINMSQNS